jgi:peptide alpha-N-acetyltransferase
MIVVEKQYRQLKIGKLLANKFIDKIKEKGTDSTLCLGGEEIVLETESTNKPALRLYESLGFARVKRMQNYYMSGNDAFRLKLWFVDPEDLSKPKPQELTDDIAI